jgi:hypothetical protein
MFKLNLTNRFQTYLLSTFIVPKFLKFCNHLTINSKKSTMVLLCYFFKNQFSFLYLCQKLDHLCPFFTILYTLPCFHPMFKLIMLKDSLFLRNVVFLLVRPSNVQFETN